MSNYHYTKGIHLAKIINDGKINTTRISNEKKEKRAVWLTRSEEWEICCSSGKLDPYTGESTTMTLIEMRDLFGVCRIKIKDNYPTFSWAKYKYTGRISAEFYENFTNFSDILGCNTSRWYYSFSPICIEHFESIEMLVGEEWIAWDETISIEDFIDICHSCNSNKKLPETKVLDNHILKQVEFLLDNQERIIEEWENNLGKIGYLEIYIDEKYEQGYIRFFEKKFKKSSFKCTYNKVGDNCLYLHLLWGATKTHYNSAFAYDADAKQIIFNEYA